MSAVRALLVAVCLLSFAADSDAAIRRSSAAIYQFKHATGYPHGRPGYVIDHITPLCAGGEDNPENMQWQTIGDAKKKDIIEKRQCAALRKHRG